MAPPVPTCIPDELTAGETWRFSLSYPAFPAGDGWALAVYFRGVGALDATMGADARVAADGDAFVVTIAAADTTVAAGVYEWIARASKDGEVYTADSGATHVRPDFASAAAGDLQSHAERTLAVIEAALENRLESGMESYQILGRAVTNIPLAELRKLRAEYRAEVARLKRNGWLPSVEVRFGRP